MIFRFTETSRQRQKWTNFDQEKLTRLRWAKTSQSNKYISLWQVKIRVPCNIYSCEIFQNPGQKRNARYACCGYTSYKTISHLRYLYHSRFHFLPWPKNRRHPCIFTASWGCFQQGMHNSVAICQQWQHPIATWSIWGVFTLPWYSEPWNSITPNPIDFRSPFVLLRFCGDIGFGLQNDFKLFKFKITP